MSAGKEIREVLVHPTKIARGYIFVVERGQEYYVLMNRNDLNASLSILPSSTVEQMGDTLMGIPIGRDEEVLDKVMTGVFQWAFSRLQ